MTIAGGGPNQEVLEEMFEDSYGDKKDKQRKMEAERRSRITKQEKYTRKIMSENAGRAWMWDFVINAPIMNINPYTGNAATYFILGEQRPTRDIIEYLKKLDLKLYHKMETEAMNKTREAE